MRGLVRVLSAGDARTSHRAAPHIFEVEWRGGATLCSSSGLESWRDLESLRASSELAAAEQANAADRSQLAFHP